jgi:hypothetical protein
MKRLFARALLLALPCALAGGLMVASAASATPNKPYSLVICAQGENCGPGQPAVVAPGSAPGTTPTPAQMSATFKNENGAATTILLGSANLTVPAGFVVTATSLPACSGSSTQACATLAGGGTQVQLRNMNVAPGASSTVGLTVDTPPPPSSCTRSAPCQWTVQAKQSNDFNGTGNDLNEDPATSSNATVLSDTTACPAGSGCQTSLADGGTASSAPASISATIAVSPGASTGTLSESLNYGQPYSCQYFPEPGHESVFWNLTGTGTTDRSKTVSITTTVFSGYQQEVCLDAPFTFTQKEPSGTGVALLPASTTTAPDGSGATWYIGLLPDCGSAPLLQVDPTQQPCVDRAHSSNNGITSTTVFTLPAGEAGDPTSYN